MRHKRHSRELLPGPTDELERWHDPAFRDRLADALLNVAALCDAKDPDATALANIRNPPSTREH